MASAVKDLWSVEGGSIVLHGRRCSACGLVIFPPQLYGCPKCGTAGDKLEPAQLPAIGRLHSFAIVNQHPVLPTPYTIVEVELDSGSLIRALFDSGSAPAIDALVVGRAAGDEGNRDLTFTNLERQ